MLPARLRRTDAVRKVFFLTRMSAEKTDQFQFMDETDSPLDILSEEERKLLESYYMKEDKNDIATNNNTTLNALYCKIKRIRKKLLSRLDETNNKRKM